MKLQFSIRDLFWLTLVVGLAVGWLISYRAYQAKIDDQQKHFSDYFNRNAIRFEETAKASSKSRAEAR